MEKVITREDIIELLSHVEHPEIAISLVDLGMIMDVGVSENIAKVAIALPMMNIPQDVRDAIEDVISGILGNFGLVLEPVYFEMSREERNKFFATARANWKGPI